MNVRRYLFDMRHIDVILFSSWKINQFLQRFFPILLLPSFYKYLIIIKQPPYFIVFLLKIRQYFFMINHRASCVWPNCALSNVLYVFSLFFWTFIFYFHYFNASINHYGNTGSHCVLLKHYIQLTSHDDLTEKLVSLVFSAKLVKWQNVKLRFVIWQKNCLCLTLLADQIFRSFWKSNPWMNLLEKKILLYQFLF